jgi:hypothetical protein
MPYSPKDWRDGPAGGTPINAAALEDIEQRLAAHADTKQSASQKGQPNGYASLDGSGRVPASQLPPPAEDAVTSVAGKTGAVALVKADVGLGNVDNTADSAKPISAAAQAALDALDARSDLLEGTSVAFVDAIRVVAAPTGVAATDTANWQAALATGRYVTTRPGTYVVNWNVLAIPDRTTVHIARGTIVRAAPNTATLDQIYVLFQGAALPPLGPVDVSILIDGEVDGNRSNGNHGLNENIHLFSLSNGTRINFILRGRCHNVRGEVLFVGRTGGGDGSGTIPNGYTIDGGGIAENIGHPWPGDADGQRARQGFAFQAGKDIVGRNIRFIGVAGYCWDFEADSPVDTFENCKADADDSCTYRDIGQGTVNFSFEGVAATVDRVFNGSRGPSKAHIAGTRPTVNVSPVVVGRARFAQKQRIVDFIVNTANVFVDIDPILEIQVPAMVDDIIECGFGAMWGNEAVFSQIEFCTLNGSGGAVISEFSGGIGVPGLVGWISTPQSVYSRMQRRLTAADITGDGVVILRPRAKTNAATNRTLYAPILFTAENKGPGW